MARVRFALVGVACVVVVAIAVGVGFQAGRAASKTAPRAPATASPLVVEVQRGTLTDRATMSVVIGRTAALEVRSRRSGTVTRVLSHDQPAVEVASGTLIGWIDEQPIAVLQGATPAYRDLTAGTNGTDVAQLQTFLTANGWFSGAVDGVWRPALTDAVKRWQRTVGASATGSVPLGSVVFLPSLPVDVAFGADLAVGRVVDAGGILFAVLTPQPDARLTVASTESRDLSNAGVVADVAGTAVTFRTRGGLLTDPQTGQTSVALDRADLAAGCPPWCRSIALGAPVSVDATVTFAGPLSGAMLPIGALQTDAGAVVATLADGTHRPVKVVLQVDGEAIVEGLNVGDRVVVPNSGSDGSTG
jgi:peptidoglycan hydrolase-like protein with peptidoglycan-binding domain